MRWFRNGVGPRFLDGRRTIQVIQRIVVYADDSNIRFFRVCPPPESTRLQIIGTFLAFAKRHPEQMNREFTDVALDSLVEAYPCR